MNTTININNSIITTDFETLDFKSLSLGQQIFLLEQKEEYDNEMTIEYSELTTYCLVQKYFDNLYSFDSIKSNFDIYLYDNNRENLELAMETNQDKSRIDYLELNGILIPIVDFDIEDEDYLSTKSKLKTNNSNINEKLITNTLEENTFFLGKKQKINVYDVKYFCNVKLDNITLATQITYTFNPTKYSFNKRIRLCLFDENLNKYLSIQLDKTGIKKLIQALKSKFNIEEIQNYINHLSIFNYTIRQLRYGEDNRNIMFKTFEDVDFGNNTIESIMNRFILPFYEDKELQSYAYIKEFYFYFSHEAQFICPSQLEYSDDKETKQKINNFKVKANAILEYITGDSYVDIYTGEMLHNDAIEKYRDVEILNIKFNNTLIFYKKIDNIYARIYDKNEINEIKKEINDRTKLCNMLSR